MSALEVESLKDENGKNKNTVICTFCPSKILNPGTASYVNVELNFVPVAIRMICIHEENLMVNTTIKVPMKLHHMQRKGQGEADQTEEISDYWMVDDMFTFENIGFSNTVDNLKYLICADCEMGPVGWHNLSEKKSYIALCRVKHA